jgi:outer membrane autotransporter protein
MDTFTFGAYGDHHIGDLVLDGAVTGAHADANSSRSVNVLGLSAHARQDGYGLGASAGVRYQVNLPFALLEPRVGLDYTYTHIGGATETGAAGANLRLGDSDKIGLRSTIGARLSHTFEMSAEGRMGVDLRLGWGHEFANPTARLTSAFVALPTAEFTTIGARAGRDAALLGAGLAFSQSKSLTLYARYDGALTVRDTSHAVTAGLRLNF